MGSLKIDERPLAMQEVRSLLYSVSFMGDRFLTDPEEIKPYLADEGDLEKIMAVVKPVSTEEIQALMNVANGYGIALYTPMPFGLAPRCQGIVVDQVKMNKIISIDSKKLIAAIEPGVTWEQMLPVVEQLGLRMPLPAAAWHPYVLPTYQEREIVLLASRYTNKQISNLHVVMTDGKIFKSGSHANPAAEERGINWREDGGPNIWRLLLGSRNMFGLPIKGYVYLYPYFEKRSIKVFGFNEMDAALKAAQFISRREMAVECLTLNKAKAEAVAGASVKSPWITVAALEGASDLVDYYEKRLGQELGKVKALDEAALAFEEAFRRPWQAPDTSVGFYTLYEKVAKFDSLMTEEGPRMVIPVKRGASVYNHYEPAKKPNAKILGKLLDAGAFFPSPSGELAHALFGRTGSYLTVVQQIKNLLDPQGIMNPDQMIEAGGEE